MKLIMKSILMLTILTVLTGILYPLLVTLVAQLLFPHKANGSMLENDGVIIGSELIGQSFTREDYFHSRPSAVDYDGANSGGTNLGASNPILLMQVDSTAHLYRQENRLTMNVFIPPDAVTASASGLDPHISNDDAMLQALRIARTRNLRPVIVQELIRSSREYPYGRMGNSVINVVKLNRSLERLKSE